MLRKPRGSPYWHYDFQVNGRRFRGSTKTAARRVAEQIETEERDRILLGKPGRVEMTLAAASERYYQEVGQFLTTAKDVDRQLEKVMGGLENPLLSAITDDDVSQMVARRRADLTKSGASVAPATVNRETELLRRVMRRARMAWRVNVAEINWGQHRLPEPQERIRELGAAEEARLFEHLRPDFHALARFCLLTGARFGAAARLTWSQVDQAAGVVVLRTKGETQHAIPITGAVRVLLANEKGKHPIYVFTYECLKSRGGRKKGQRYPFSKNGWRRAWGEALVAAGIQDFRFHDTRHTAATRVLRASRNLKVVQQMLGHTTIATTARYAHALLDDVRQGMEAAEARQENVKVAKPKNAKPLKDRA